MRPRSSLIASFLAAGLLLVASFPATAQTGAAVVIVSPVSAVNEVGTSHTVTGTALTASGQPASGITIRFSVTGTRTLGVACGTDSSGQCSFTYSSGTPGTDTIVAYADNDGDATQDSDEPSGIATKIWIARDPDPLPDPDPEDDDDGDDEDSDESDVFGDDSDISV